MLPRRDVAAPATTSGQRLPMSPTKRGGRRGLTRNQAEPGLKGGNMQLDLSAPKVVTFKYQLDPCIDRIGTRPLLPFLSRFLFHGAVRLTQETPTRGWARAFFNRTIGFVARKVTRDKESPGTVGQTPGLPFQGDQERPPAPFRASGVENLATGPRCFCDKFHSQSRKGDG